MISRFFIHRPIFATVISIVILIAGAVSQSGLPVAKFPEITPPTVQVTAFYPGANAEVIAETVAAPIEQEVNGVEDMIYMSSTSADDGSYTLNVTFDIGTDMDMATVLVQNRVAIATSKLPEDVRRQGVTTKKKSTQIVQFITLTSRRTIRRFVPEQLCDDQHQGRTEPYSRRGFGDGLRGGRLQHADLARSAQTQGSQPDDRGRGGGDQRAERAGGRRPNRRAAGTRRNRVSVGRQYAGPPARREAVRRPDHQDHRGWADHTRQRCRARRTGRKELQSFLKIQRQECGDRFHLPVARGKCTGVGQSDPSEDGGAERRFPEGLEYAIPFDTTRFVEASINEVYETLYIAVILVVLVIFIFLQDWRATLIPCAAIPVSLIGTFAVMAGIGFSINMLTLFGIVLAIGIVVDDAIVVVENTARHLDAGLNPKEAATKAMEEITGPVIATTLVLLAVFVPTAFMGGITGQLYRQFALTISGAVLISTINALTLSPALCGILMRPSAERNVLLFRWFNSVVRCGDQRLLGCDSDDGAARRHRRSPSPGLVVSDRLGLPVDCRPGSCRPKIKAMLRQRAVARRRVAATNPESRWRKWTRS